MTKIIECNRCGVCWLIGNCGYGKLKKNGICRFLYFENGLAYCKLLVKGKVKKQDIGINGKGCMIQHFPEYYNFHKQINRQIIKDLTIGS